MTAMRCRELSMAYGRREVLTRVSLEVAQGSVYALLGRNGAGKSTLISALLGLQKPSAGQVQILGLDAWQAREQTMEHTGVVPETPQAPPRMSSAQLSVFCGRLGRGWDPAAVAARLERFQIDPDRAFGQLSRGQQTQVALALALGHHPQLLILDDPTLGLDPVARRDLYRELLEDLADRGTTVFIATHDLAGIEGIADRVAILDQGALLLDEPLEQLKARCRRIRSGPELAAEALAAMAPAVTAGNAFGGETLVTRYSPAALAAAGLEPDAATGVSLEDLFLASVSEGAKA